MLQHQLVAVVTFLFFFRLAPRMHGGKLGCSRPSQDMDAREDTVHTAEIWAHLSLQHSLEKLTNARCARDSIFPRFMM